MQRSGEQRGIVLRKAALFLNRRSLLFGATVEGNSFFFSAAVFGCVATLLAVVGVSAERSRLCRKRAAAQCCAAAENGRV